MNTTQGIPGVIKSEHNNNIQEWSTQHYGMFIHFGLYSLLGGKWQGEPVTKGYSEQIQMWANIPADEYEALMDEFTIENFNVEKIVSLAKKSDMKYIVLTSKHHDGFCLFDTKTTAYNAVDSTPFGKDIVKLFADECQKQGLKFGLYYSLVDWHAGHEYDLNNNNMIPSSIEKLIKEQLTELMTNYGEIIEVWFDMGHPTNNQSIEFSKIVRQHQPHAAINGRIWNNLGDFRTLGDNQIPTTRLEGLWQTPASIYNETWSYREWQERGEVYEKAKELLENLISIRARGGNYLLNIGPKGDGSLVLFESEVLEMMGSWLDRHSKAVLGSFPTRFSKHSWGEITYSDQNLYLHLFDVPTDGKLTLKGLSSSIVSIIEENNTEELKWEKLAEELVIYLPENFVDSFLPVLKVQLAEELYILPENISKQKDGKWKICATEIENSYNFVDEGYYNSLKRTNVEQRCYISNQEDTDILLTIDGQVDENLDYSITVGNQEKIISGSDILKNKSIDFKLEEATKTVPIIIKLWKPANRYQDIALEINYITLEKITNL